jgi:MT0933-like antitoxin protein
MSEFMDEAKKLAGEHPDIVNKEMDQATQFAESKTGGQFDSEIQGAEQQAEGYAGTDQQGSQDQQGQQNY